MTDALAPLDLPPETALLRSAQQKAGLTIADLAVATGLSAGTVQNALSGLRYRDGKPRPTVAPDRTLLKIASVLHIRPAALRGVGRNRAADLLEQAARAESDAPIAPISDREAQAAVAGRAALARRLAALLSTEELRAELERRDRAEQDEIEREVHADLADEWRSSR